MSSYEKFNSLCALIRSCNAPFKKQMISNSRQSGARFWVDYTAKNRKNTIESVINIQSACEQTGKLLGIELADSANYFEKDEQIFRRSVSIISCKNFDEVENISPITHGRILIEVQF